MLGVQSPGTRYLGRASAWKFTAVQAVNMTQAPSLLAFWGDKRGRRNACGREMVERSSMPKQLVQPRCSCSC